MINYNVRKCELSFDIWTSCDL